MQLKPFNEHALLVILGTGKGTHKFVQYYSIECKPVKLKLNYKATIK